MRIRAAVLSTLLFCQMTARSEPATTLVTRSTDTTEIRLTFTNSKVRELEHTTRYWCAGNRRRLAYPALQQIEYALEERKYVLPGRLVAGIGSINLKALSAAGTSPLVIRDDDRWTVITLRGSDGSTAFIAEWRIERSTGNIIRYVRDLEMPGRFGTTYGPEVLTGQAVQLQTRNSE
jgi:hypothetical protein